MESFNEFVDHQGFYDYINHFISGAILVIGIEMLTSLFDLSLIKEIYGALRLIPISPNINEFLWNICVITVFALLCFFVGIFVQELYNVIYNKNPEEKDDVQSKIKDKTPYGINRLFHKVNEYAYVPQMFDNSGIIINSNKRAEYEKYARKLAAKKELNKKEGISEVIPEEKIQIDRKLVIYFFSYCEYYIQVRDKNKKTEKLRDIEGLSMSLSLVFYILVWIAIITLFVLMVISVQFCGMKEILFLRIANRADKIALTIISIIVCTIASIAFDYRAERALKNRIKMTLAIYEAEMDKIKDLEK